MTQTVEMYFDGEALRPQTPLKLDLHRLYSVVITDERPDREAAPDAWQVLEALTGAVDAPEDWSAEHDHYISGSPKRAAEDSVKSFL